jgi:hypothetical protein
MGANIDQQFLAAGLVDVLRLHLVNVLLGGGRRLFDQLLERVELEQTGRSQTGLIVCAARDSNPPIARSVAWCSASIWSGSRLIWPAQVGGLVGPDGSRRVPSDRLDDQAS